VRAEIFICSPSERALGELSAKRYRASGRQARAWRAVPFAPMEEALQRAIEADRGARITGVVRGHGGDVARAYAVELDDDRRVFSKTHPSAPPGFFTTEATGLSWLRASSAVAVPEVLAVSDDPPNHLVLEWIDEGPARPG